MKHKGLGKGLSALISKEGYITDSGDSASVMNLDINELEPNRYQPRKNFDEEGIKELSNSIMVHGIIQPIVVRKHPDNEKYEIVAGERRWRAAKISGLKEVPVVLKAIGDAALGEQALIENILRKDLNPLEEANAYSEIMTRYNYTQEELAKTIGKNRSHIANMLRLIVATDIVKNFILSGELSFSHAKVMATHEDANNIALEIINKNLNVRQTEALVKNWKKPVIKKETSATIELKNDDDLSGISEDLREKLGLKVDIDAKGTKGKVVIHYNNYEQLDNIIELLSK